MVKDENGMERPKKETKTISRPSRLSVSYNDIFVYNIKATQELHKKNKALEIKVKDLEIENFLLKERVKDLESKMNDVLNRLAQLENN